MEYVSKTLWAASAAVDAPGRGLQKRRGFDKLPSQTSRWRLLDARQPLRGALVTHPRPAHGPQLVKLTSFWDTFFSPR